jgi:hypothetical protein
MTKITRQTQQQQTNTDSRNPFARFLLLHRRRCPKTTTKRHGRLAPVVVAAAVPAANGSLAMSPIVQTSPLPLPLSTASLKYAHHPTSPTNKAISTTKDKLVDKHQYIRTMDEFMSEVKMLFEAPLPLPNLRAMSAGLQEQFREKLSTSGCCMLPSYIHTLPSGNERGTYLALDVGGSNLRIALVELCGKPSGKENSDGKLGGTMRIVEMLKYRMDNGVRGLKGTAFFDWVAERIEQCIQNEKVQAAHGSGVFAMGVAWSFPIEYVFPFRCEFCVV